MFIDLAKKYEKNSILIAVIMIALALFLIIKPLASILFIINIFSIIMIFEGILHIVSYYKTEKELRLMSFELVEGIVETIIGILIICSGKYLTAYFSAMIGIWMIIKSILKFQIGMNLKMIPDSSSTWTIISSILTFILGFVVILNPFSSITVVTRILGIFIVIYEIMNIIESIHMIKILKD